MSASLADITQRIREQAISLGFTACGFAPAHRLDEDAQRLKTWLEEGKQAGMQYMQNHFEQRVNPQILVPGAKSVIVVLLNYFPAQRQQEENNYIVSKYAYGRDYHKVLKAMLKKLMQFVHSEIAPLNGRAFVDSAPVLERAWAALSGLGWIGKNANLISPLHGSFVFIGEIITDIELQYNTPIPDYCGGCTKCIQACPTQAIVGPRIIDSNRCISNWTIEHKGELPENLRGKFKRRIFGCDICQDVCPWNRKVKAHNLPDFNPHPLLLSLAQDNWKQLNKETFDEMFGNSAVKRTGFDGLKRNIEFVG